MLAYLITRIPNASKYPQIMKKVKILMNKQSLHLWSIEARALKIPYTPFTHNFWALTDENNNVIDQIHGLAVDPQTGTTKAIGSSSDLLQVIRGSNFKWSLRPNQLTVICTTGQETVTKQIWQAAVNSFHKINALQLHYPNLWQHFYKKNSNTIFNTIGQIMGIDAPAHLLPTCAPGIHLIISQNIINQYRYKNGEYYCSQDSIPLL
jgi:hypothetical protein